MASIFLTFISSLFFISGCTNNKPSNNNQTDTTVVLNGTFTGYIFLENGEPYSHGSVKATGKDWISISNTDEFGAFRIEVLQDSRFIFSALSQFEENKFYQYSTPIVINEEETDLSYDCFYNIDIEDCYDSSLITSRTRSL